MNTAKILPYETCKTKKTFSFWGGFAPPTRPHDQGLCPGPRWGPRPQTPVIEARAPALAISWCPPKICHGPPWPPVLAPALQYRLVCKYRTTTLHTHTQQMCWVGKRIYHCYDNYWSLFSIFIFEVNFPIHFINLGLAGFFLICSFMSVSADD